MNTGSCHTRRFRSIDFSVFGFTGPKSFRSFWETGPFIEEFCELRTTMQESNQEEGIISSGSYYFFYIITVNEKSYVRKLKDMTFFKAATSRFAQFFSSL